MSLFDNCFLSWATSFSSSNKLLTVIKRSLPVLDKSFNINAESTPDETREFLEKEAEDTGVPISNLASYIVGNYVRDEKKKRQLV